jgi:two-component system, NarL family, response regulator NreC
MPDQGKIGVLLVDDHSILRGGLKLLINSQYDMQVLGDTGSGKEALRLCGLLSPDIILLDITLTEGSGLDFIHELRACKSKVKVLVLTMHEEEAYLSEAMRLGASGYILKKAADVELISAIRAVYRGEMVVDPAMTPLILSKIYGGSRKERNIPVTELTPRELEVLKLVALGHTNRQIAEHMVISTKTVESHKANIKEKLNIHKRSELVRYAMEQGIFDS